MPDKTDPKFAKRFPPGEAPTTPWSAVARQLKKSHGKAGGENLVLRNEAKPSDGPLVWLRLHDASGGVS